RCSKPPALHFGWPEMTLLEASWSYLVFGAGNIPWRVRELVHREAPDPEHLPRVIVGGGRGSPLSDGTGASRGRERPEAARGSPTSVSRPFAQGRLPNSSLTASSSPRRGSRPVRFGRLARACRYRSGGRGNDVSA